MEFPLSKDTSHPIFDSLPENQVLRPVITDQIVGDEAKGFVANIYRKKRRWITRFSIARLCESILNIAW